jgi:hypothetical protein
MHAVAITEWEERNKKFIKEREESINRRGKALPISTADDCEVIADSSAESEIQSDSCSEEEEDSDTPETPESRANSNKWDYLWDNYWYSKNLEEKRRIALSAASIGHYVALEELLCHSQDRRWAFKFDYPPIIAQSVEDFIDDIDPAASSFVKFEALKAAEKLLVDNIAKYGDELGKNSLLVLAKVYHELLPYAAIAKTTESTEKPEALDLLEKEIDSYSRYWAEEDDVLNPYTYIDIPTDIMTVETDLATRNELLEKALAFYRSYLVKTGSYYDMDESDYRDVTVVMGRLLLSTDDPSKRCDLFEKINKIHDAILSAAGYPSNVCYDAAMGYRNLLEYVTEPKERKPLLEKCINLFQQYLTAEENEDVEQIIAEFTKELSQYQQPGEVTP